MRLTSCRNFGHHPTRSESGSTIENGTVCSDPPSKCAGGHPGVRQQGQRSALHRSRPGCAFNAGRSDRRALQNARLVSDLKSLNADITDLNDELTRTNRRLEKLDAAKTNFIQIASHELRTPLTQVRGYSDIMADAVQSGSPTPAQMAQISQGISRASVRLEEIISAMLDASQIDIEALSLRLDDAIHHDCGADGGG